MQQKLKKLAESIEGELYTDSTHLILYATDASAYREIPTAVCVPQSYDDVRKVIAFSSKEGLPIIPRTAGTSLAGQVVGNGIIVDLSKNFRRILEINPEDKNTIASLLKIYAISGDTDKYKEMKAKLQ